MASVVFIIHLTRKVYLLAILCRYKENAICCITKMLNRAWFYASVAITADYAYMNQFKILIRICYILNILPCLGSKKKISSAQPKTP